MERRVGDYINRTLVEVEHVDQLLQREVVAEDLVPQGFVNRLHPVPQPGGNEGGIRCNRRLIRELPAAYGNGIELDAASCDSEGSRSSQV